MFEILAHADLSHQLVLVPVHAGQLPDVRKHVLQTVRQLECVHVVEPVLNVRVDDELRQTQDFSAQVERWNKRGTLLGVNEV